MSEVEAIACTAGFGETFADDYGSAVVHVVWERKKSQRTLLLAWVELLPREISSPDDEGEACTRVQDSYLYVRHVVTTADRALRWYRDCARGIAVRPANDGTLPEPAPDVGTLAMSSTDDEPRWPNLVCTDSASLPFLANWYACPRVHHLIQPGFTLSALWNDTQQANARRWLSEQLHFDVADHGVLWGSVHLVAPNPVFRSLSQGLEHSEDRKQERLLLHVQARDGHRADGLLLRFLERRPTGICVSRHWTLTGPTLVLQFDHILSETAIEIHDPRRGLLWFESPAHFLTSVGVQMSIASGTRVISDERGPLLEVPLVTDMPPTSVGAPAPIGNASAQVLLAEASTKHEQHEQRRAMQRWFSGQHEEAIAIVHELIRHARRQVVIVDPYFARTELRFAVAVSRVVVPVSVLTSHDGLIELEKNGEPQDEFVASVARFRATPNSHPLEVRVMAGAGIHDRFLVVDDRVFLLGSSLNRFGDRGTMLVELRDPATVRGELLRELSASKPLPQWLTDRRAAQRAQVSADTTTVVNSTSTADTMPAIELASSTDTTPAVESTVTAETMPAIESISNEGEE
ncbi:MAG TPA: VPA1262 family N-terminal domain-containing protein [Kofleriaceae bacterium]